MELVFILYVVNIDIVIPCLNEAENLTQLLPFLRDNIHNEKARIIVVDSKDSKDESELICRNYDVLYLRAHQSQRARQMNIGAKNGDSQAILFLHADVLPPKNFYSLIEKALLKFEFGMFAYQFDNPNLFLRVNAFFTRFDSFYTGGGDQCFFIRKSVFDELNGFDETYKVMEDFEFFSRIRECGKSYTLLPQEALVSARKYVNKSYFRVNWFNLKMLLAFRRGEDPETLNIRYEAYKRARKI